MRKNKIKDTLKINKAERFLQCFLLFLCGLILARTRIFNSISFLGLAFSSACPAPFFAWAAFGASAGYLSLFEGIHSIRFIVCTLGCAMIKGFSLRFNKRTNIFFIPSVASLCLISSFLALLISDEADIKKSLFYIIEALLTFVFTFSLKNPLEYFLKTDFITLNLTHTAVLISVFYYALCSVSFLSFSLPRITGALAILIFSYIFKEKGGTLCSAAVGLTSALSVSDINLGAIFSFSGLVSSLFFKWGQVGLSAVFLICICVLTYLNPNENSVALISQSASACLIFILIPKEKLEELKERFNKPKDENNINSKIQLVKTAIISVGEEIKGVLNELSIIENRDESLKENEKCTELRRALADSFLTSADILNEIEKQNDSKETLKSQKPQYQFELGFFQQSGGESKHCGDSIKYKIEKDKISRVLLSDGMGTGARAAVDSKLTVELFSQLIEGQISKETSLKLINSALIAKSQDETLATLDYLTLNPFSGEIKISKAGAAPSFILKNNKSFIIEPVSLPVGILRDVKFFSEKFILGLGDRIIMLSDGALTDDFSWVGEIIKDKKLNAQGLCGKIAQTARALQENSKKDDLTVIVIDVKRA